MHTGQQSMLAGFDVLEAVDPVFFALRPQAEVVGQLQVEQRRLTASPGWSGDRLDSDVFHLTLQPVDVHAASWDAVVAGARRIGAELRAQAFEITLERALSFDRGQRARAWVLVPADDSPKVAALQRQLYLALHQSRLGGMAKPTWRPHVTLAYSNGVLPISSIAPIRWPIGEVALIRSHYGLGRHEVLGHWPLTEDAA